MYTYAYVLYVSLHNHVLKFRKTTGGTGQLRIPKVDKSLDAGDFQCVATNISDSQDKVFSDVLNLNIKCKSYVF